MPDKPVRAIDPLGIIALAHVVVRYGPDACCECSCEGIPVGCTCESECSCEGIPVPCPCQTEPDQTNILDMVSNPIFREVVQGFDIKKMRTIEDFLFIVDEIQKKLDASTLHTRDTDAKKQ